MSPLAQTAAFTRAAQPRSREINVGSRRRAQLRVTSFAHIRPSEVAVEGPGTGLRHYPDPSHGQYEPRAAPHGDERHHDMMSSEACYRLFPLITHASVPLHIEDQEPAGLSVLNRLSDAGPASGRRRRRSHPRHRFQLGRHVCAFARRARCAAPWRGSMHAPM